VAAEITDHKDDLAAIAKEQTDGSSDKVKQLARDAKPVVESHLKLLEHIRNG
jgi:putative membrane protein